jgi:hypothetical protein
MANYKGAEFWGEAAVAYHISGQEKGTRSVTTQQFGFAGGWYCLRSVEGNKIGQHGSTRFGIRGRLTYNEHSKTLAQAMDTSRQCKKSKTKIIAQ